MPDHAEDERVNQYRICQVRGHVAGGEMRLSNPPWLVCAYCGTLYRYESKLIESNAPIDSSGALG